MHKRTLRSLSLAFLVLFVAICFSSSGKAKADEVYTFVVKKQEEKEKTRWSLDEWLKTRDKMRLMDMWLALHSPSPYEFFLGGQCTLGRTDTSGVAGSIPIRTYGAAYASIFGLGIEKGFSPASEWLASFYLRIFGYHAQGTNITLQTGVRSENEPYSLRNAFGGVGLSVYLSKHFGIDGFWRHHFTSVPNAMGVDVSGNHYEGGAFIDFKFVRVYGMYFQLLESVGSAETKKTGIDLGTRIFF
jgi:hypothetical protein